VVDLADGVVDEQVCIVEGVIEPFGQLTNAGLQDRLRSEVPLENQAFQGSLILVGNCMSLP
jgi:hypothetical protein